MIYNIVDYIKNKHYDELKEFSPYLRQAMLFKHVIEEMPLKITDEDFIAGWYGFEENDFKENSDKKDFLKINVLTPEQAQLKEHLNKSLKCGISFNSAHTCIDYEIILNKGLEYYVMRLEEELSVFPDNQCLISMKIALNASYEFAERFKNIAKEKAKKAETSEKKKRFENIYSSLSRVPRFCARNFHEAVQSLWLMHSLIPMAEMSWESISVGRIDQYLYPFYKKHVEDGGTKEEAKEILKNLFVLLDSYGDGACAMNIGGMNEKGKDMINELSVLLIEVEKELSLRAPIFAVRVTPDMPQDVFDSLIDFNLFKIGQPTFYGEIPCRNAMLHRGLSQSEANNFSVNSCMGLILAGNEFADMWGIKFNSHLPLELAVNHGKPFNCNLEIELSTIKKDATNFEELLQQYNHYLRELISVCANIYEKSASEQEANFPDPFLSALTEGCIKNHRDRANGATYNTVTIETLGLVNTCDALAAIKTLVFEQKKYSLNDFIIAAKANFEGFEQIRTDILNCKKYGMNDSGVNLIFKKLCDMVSDACKKSYHDNRLFLPSLHTIDANVGYGAKLYATLDGRKEGEPVNKNANPSSLLRKTEHTSHILSATAFKQSTFSGGQPIDLFFDKEWFKTKETKDKIKALILTYFQFDGLQLQVNAVDIELLEKVHREPKKYPYVIVRKGGFSVRFSEMSFFAREDFIKSSKQAVSTK